MRLILKSHRISKGLVVDLGCGSGLLAEKLSAAGYHVLGIDASPAFISIARKRVPSARFRRGSLFKAALPRCAALVSTGEVLNYMFDPESSLKGLARLFRRVHAALEPGGLFLFDLADPGQVLSGRVVRGFTEGSDWVVLVDKKEDHQRHLLTRRIITFRKAGEKWRRGEEIHRQRLYEPSVVLRLLTRAGFHSRAFRRYGSFRLPEGHTAFLARKARVRGFSATDEHRSGNSGALPLTPST
ncbi:class I SAM-dependent methyltransferase [bacterium]|nr:MAG: class I SAM-dependent methyltransferase [bacterium]